MSDGFHTGFTCRTQVILELIILEFPCQNINIGECHCVFFLSHSTQRDNMYRGVVKLSLVGRQHQALKSLTSGKFSRVSSS